MDLLSWILTFSIILGQLIKIPIGTHGGATLLDATVIGLCLLGLDKLRFHLKKPPLFILSALFFIFIALFSLIITPLKLTPQELLTSLSYIIRFSSFILLGWLIYLGTFHTMRKNIPQIFLISGLTLAILGLLQFIFLPDLGFLTNWGWDPHYLRTASTFLDPNFLGAYMVLTLILWYQNFAMAKKWYLFIGVIIYLTLLTTFSRGAYLAFLTSFGTLSILHRSARLGVITILLFTGLILGFTTYQKLVAQPRGIDRTQSAEFRLATWQQGWQLFSSHPILGVGFNTYRYALKQYNLGDEQFLKSHGSSTNDSSLLYVLTTTGILGFTTYLIFLFALVKSGSREKILPAGLVGLVAQSFFANNLFYPPILLWIILMATYGEDKTSS